jgi:hypothetical protein
VLAFILPERSSSCADSTSPPPPVRRKTLHLELFVLRVSTSTIFPHLSASLGQLTLLPTLQPLTPISSSTTTAHSSNVNTNTKSGTFSFLGHPLISELSSSPNTLSLANEALMQTVLHKAKEMLADLVQRAVTHSERDLFWNALFTSPPSSPASPTTITASNIVPFSVSLRPTLASPTNTSSTTTTVTTTTSTSTTTTISQPSTTNLNPPLLASASVATSQQMASFQFGLNEAQFNSLMRLIYCRHIEEIDSSLRQLFTLSLPWSKELVPHLLQIYGSSLTRQYRVNQTLHLFVLNSQYKDLMLHLLVGENDSYIEIFACRRELEPTYDHAKQLAEAKHISEVVNLIVHFCWRWLLSGTFFTSKHTPEK